MKQHIKITAQQQMRHRCLNTMGAKDLGRIILAISALLLSSLCYANPSSAERLYALADAQYDAEDYQTAAELLKLALKKEPNSSKIHHLLGKSYGRLAENSNWLSAIELSQKTLVQLEKAVELDNKNIPAISDLIKFYRQAPSFLGGNEEEANRLTARLETLRAQTRYSSSEP